MEELRSSLYNEMHSSEGAKRQQQRFCGPSVALTFNFAVAVGIIMANKMVVIFFFKKKVYSFLYTRANFFFWSTRKHDCSHTGSTVFVGDGECWV